MYTARGLEVSMFKFIHGSGPLRGLSCLRQAPPLLLPIFFVVAVDHHFVYRFLCGHMQVII